MRRRHVIEHASRTSSGTERGRRVVACSATRRTGRRPTAPARRRHRSRARTAEHPASGDRAPAPRDHRPPHATSPGPLLGSRELDPEHVGSIAGNSRRTAGISGMPRARRFAAQYAAISPRWYATSCVGPGARHAEQLVARDVDVAQRLLVLVDGACRVGQPLLRVRQLLRGDRRGLAPRDPRRDPRCVRQVREHRGARVDQQVDHQERQAADDRSERVEPGEPRPRPRGSARGSTRSPTIARTGSAIRIQTQRRSAIVGCCQPQERAQAVRAEHEHDREARGHHPREDLGLAEQPERDRVQRELGEQDRDDRGRVDALGRCAARAPERRIAVNGRWALVPLARPRRSVRGGQVDVDSALRRSRSAASSCA